MVFAIINRCNLRCNAQIHGENLGNRALNNFLSIPIQFLFKSPRLSGLGGFLYQVAAMAETFFKEKTLIS
jgi:hypothetical protein